jgi:hypothetical protein
LIPTISQRAVNRATLARQLLLERSTIDILAAVEHLAGLQAQTPHTWYVGLWNRLADLDPDEVGALLVRRELAHAFDDPLGHRGRRTWHAAASGARDRPEH